MEVSCFRCGHAYDTNRPKPQFGLPSRCPQCGWDGGSALPEKEERYLVLLSLIYRSETDGERIHSTLFRIPASAREMAVLEHGDQCVLDGIHWRITAKNREKNVFFLRGTRNVIDREGRLHEFSPAEPAEEMIEEANRWESIWQALYFLRDMPDDKFQEYLKLPEEKKGKIRNTDS